MRFFSALILAVVTAVAAHANAPELRFKPEPPHFSELLSPADFERLREGLEAASDGRWSAVRVYEDAISDPSARRILFWRRATSDTGMSFSDLDRALTELQHWPRFRDIQSEAEARIRAAGMTAGEIALWFEVRPPVSGAGRVALAEAYFTLGRAEEGRDLLREAWRYNILPLDLQREVRNTYGGQLTQDDHIARVDYLLWRGQRTAARRLFGLLPNSYRRLSEARIRLSARQRGVDAAVDAVPSSLQDHPALLFERAVWRRRAGMRDRAEPLIQDIPANLDPPVANARVWRERRIYVRRAMSRGDYQAAYEMAAANGMTRGVDFADAEFLAGWLALRQLNRPADAAVHFARLEQGVTTPISTSRALYWQGRAAAAMGLSEQAEEFYRRGAEFPYVYYGQLAGTEVGLRIADLPEPVPPTEAERAAFASRDVPRALRMLSELDDLTLFRQVAYAYDDSLTDPTDIALLSEIAREYGQPGIGVRAGKAGLRQGIIATDALYPIVELPPLPYGAPEEAFVLALMRQESEFYPRAVSHAGARGLMQLMPATARLTARAMGERYQRSWLTDDPEYNMRIGTGHLAELMDQFNGSYVLIACAYNAGPGRARRWIRQFGDPRDPNVDVVDWVESITISETRDYVQRVMENLQVYRSRLNGGSIQIALDTDLTRGYP